MNNMTQSWHSQSSQWHPGVGRRQARALILFLKTFVKGIPKRYVGLCKCLYFLQQRLHFYVLLKIFSNRNKIHVFILVITCKVCQPQEIITGFEYFDVVALKGFCTMSNLITLNKKHKYENSTYMKKYIGYLHFSSSLKLCCWQPHYTVRIVSSRINTTFSLLYLKTFVL